MRNRAFIVLALSVFSSTLGIGMVSPILPVVAKELGTTGAWLGLSFSAFAVSQAAAEWAAAGNRVYPFHLGDINLLTPANIVEAMAAKPELKTSPVSEPSRTDIFSATIL